jgi:putative ATP-dependent endonuclease of the OLD family
LQKFVQGIRLINYCRFQNLSLDFDDSLNLLIGDNESGKSSILSAIDIVLSGSRSKVEAIGLDKLFNTNVVKDFLNSEKDYSDLPILCIEVFLNDFNKKELDGKSHPSGLHCHGLYMLCVPRDDLSSDIKKILDEEGDNFPFEYYSIVFKTFADQSYTGYSKFVRHLTIDNSKISNDYATKSYINTVYQAFADGAERNQNLNKYRSYKDKYSSTELATINSQIEDYSFAVKSNSKNNLETDLTITENGIDIENKGMGCQCFIRTEFALQKNGKDLDIILLEEPENHLSHTNMHKLVQRIKDADCRQIFISTHSNLISARLNLRKSILLNSSSFDPLQLNDLDEDTARFFMKAPDSNILEFIMSKKVILVEGDAEYILMKQFYLNSTAENVEKSGIHIISVGGTSFKRYLSIAKILNIKTAVIRDNDGKYIANITESYAEYTNDYIQVFSDSNDDIKTFEIAVFNINEQICNELFEPGRRTLSVLEYMLSNKAECAFELLEKKGNDLSTPYYIERAINWIRE